MKKASRTFQVFVKPIGPVCNLNCNYCYYLKKKNLYQNNRSFRMTDDILEKYIIEHIEASADKEIRFSWHGGEPTLLGLEYFKKIISLQRKHKPANQIIKNGMQTNGTLLDDDWCSFFADEGFTIGLSLDGPQEIHDKYRLTSDGKPTHHITMRGYELLKKHNVYCDMLCVVNSYNVRYPSEVYQFFRRLEAPYISFLPVVEPQSDAHNGVSSLTVPSKMWGDFLCTTFDIWISQDIGKIKIQIFEEAARTAFGQDHSLCIFRKTCGDIPVIEHNGDFYSCDHFVDTEHLLGNIRETSLIELLESPEQKAFGQKKLDLLPPCCLNCEVLDMCNGGCPKNRFIETPDGKPGLNYLCEGYKQFFTHCKPFVSAVATQWRRQQNQKQMTQAMNPVATQKIGRNDPCPCGSGKKYKACCLRKQS